MASKMAASQVIREVGRASSHRMYLVPKKISTVSLDVTGTIIRFKGQLGDIYCLAARRCGQQCPDYDRVYDGFKRSYKEVCAEHPCFGADKITTKEWWRECVLRSFQYAGYEYDQKTFEQIFQRIYSAFGSTRAYEAYDDVLPFMNWVKERGLQLGIISNETERYGDGILPMFGFDDALDFMVFSKTVGAEKPDPKIFQYAMLSAGESDPSRVLHIGDSLRKDFEGAKNVGLRALLIDRFDTKEASDWRTRGLPVCKNLHEAKRWMLESNLVD